MMSYCRIGDDSDVYVICSAAGYVISPAWEKIVHLGGDLGPQFVVDGPMKAVTILLMLRHRGLTVPQRAIDRLMKEARP